MDNNQKSSSTQPPVKKGDWVCIGKGTGEKDACIVDIANTGEEQRVFAAYLQYSDWKAIKKEIVWRDDHWEFKYNSGSYLHGNWEAILRKGPPSKRVDP